MVTGLVNIENARVFLKSAYPIVDMEITLDIDKWQDWQVSIKKDVLSASYKETTFPFNFIGKAAEKLTEIFQYYYGNTRATVEVWTSWVDNQATKKEVYDLDFSTYNKSDDGVSISCRNISLRTLIKKNGGTEFSIPIIDVAEPYAFRYKSNKVKNILRLRRADTVNYGWYNISYVGNPAVFKFDIYKEHKPTFTFLDSDVTVKDCVEYFEEPDVEPIKILKDGNYTLSYETKGEINALSMSHTSTAAQYYLTKLQNLLMVNGVQNVFGVTYRILVSGVEKASLYRTCSLVQSETQDNGMLSFRYAHTETSLDQTLLSWTGELHKDDKVSVSITFDRHPNSASGVGHVTGWDNNSALGTFHSTSIQFYGTGNLIVEWSGSNNIIRNMRCVKIASLLKAILSRMGSNKVIQVNVLAPHIDDIVLIPKDVIVGIVNPEINISYNTLLSFLKMLCCDVKFKSDSVDIIPMYGANGVYDNTIMEGIYYSENECADLRVSPYTELTFSEIEIGSKVEQTDEMLTNLEFNVAATYITKTESTNKLDLTTPIRTDTTGFEKIIPTASGKSADTAKTIFAFDVSLQGIVYEPKVTTTSSTTQTFINGAFAPRFLLKRWLPILNSSTDVFVLASSTKRTDIIVNGQLLTSDVSKYTDDTGYPVLHPIVYDIATSDRVRLISKDHLNGIVSFTYNGEIYYGFALSIDENPLLRKQKEIKLLRKGDNHVQFPYGILSKQPELVKSCIAESHFTTTFSVIGGNGLLNQAPIRLTSDFVTLESKSFSGTSGTFVLSVSRNTGIERECSIFIKLYDNIEYLICHIVQKADGEPHVDIETVELSWNGAYSDDTTSMLFINAEAKNITSLELSKLMLAEVSLPEQWDSHLFGKVVTKQAQIAPYAVIAAKREKEKISLFSFGAAEIKEESTVYETTKEIKIYTQDGFYVLPIKLTYQ